MTTGLMTAAGLYGQLATTNTLAAIPGSIWYAQNNTGQNYLNPPSPPPVFLDRRAKAAYDVMAARGSSFSSYVDAATASAVSKAVTDAIMIEVFESMGLLPRESSKLDPDMGMTGP